MSMTDNTEPKERGGLDALDLAAYLDGTVDAAERERIDAWLAARPEALELFLAARDALGDPPGPAPDALVTRACALVPERGAGAGGISHRILGRLAGPADGPAPSWRPFAWSGAAAAMVLACTLGFQLGQVGYAGAVEVERHMARDMGSVLGQSAEDFL